MTEHSPTEDAKDEDTGMPVIDEDEQELGVVDEVSDDEATIDPAEDLDDETRSNLGWDDADSLQAVPREALERLPHDGVEAYVEAFRIDPDDV